MNIIDERNIRTIHRKLRKKEYDDIMTLAVSDGQWVRLLDEGMVVDIDGRPLFYIMKGTLRKYYESIPDDYAGSINLGHMSFATYPILLGQWTKDDLRLVDIGDGREALDVRLRLDEELSVVKDLRRMDYTLGVSAEFSFHRNEEFTEKYDLEILDGLFIHNFAIVGDAGNVNSSGIELKGENKMTLQEFTAALDNEKTVDLAAVNKKLDALLEGGTEPEKDDTAQEAAEAPVSTETPEQAETVADEQKAASETEEDAQEAEAEVPAEEPKALSVIAAVMEKLTKENVELKAENEKLAAQLAAKDKAEQEFLNKFKSLSVSLSTERATKDAEKEPAEEVGYTDGIGEI